MKFKVNAFHEVYYLFCRSSRYSSDVGKMIGCPVLHVNGANPEVNVSCDTRFMPLIFF